jgi:hypothetical protein
VLRLLAAAAVLTLLNAVKPVVIDDTAYLFFARQISQHPLDPYGFELFWYSNPLPAMQILLPPVVPYWLGLGITIFGEQLFLLKLWLFPFAWLLAWALRDLLDRFAPHSSPKTLWLLILSAFVLPLFNFMLDVPALALGLTALVCYLRAITKSSLSCSALSGVALALALQTKYSMLTIPVAIVGATLIYGGWRQLIVVVLVSVALFGGWELWLLKQYGTSHFWLHVRDQSSTDNWLQTKLNLIAPSLTFLGLLAAGWGLYAARAVGFPNGVIYGVTLFGTFGTLAVACTPSVRNLFGLEVNLPNVVFTTLGVGLLVTLLLAVKMMLLRWPSFRPRFNKNSLFLIGWLVLEGLAYFVLTPFPAGRRVMTLSLVMALVACRVVALRRMRPEWYLSGYLLFTGLGLFALDTWDALPERELARQAAAIVKPSPGCQYWTHGHWGWQYYTDRQGMRLVDLGQTVFQVGDVLVVPREPDPNGFYRPWHGFANFKLEENHVELVGTLVWEDWISGQTIPNLYGGFYPIVSRHDPRLRVEVYRVLKGWTPTR